MDLKDRPNLLCALILCIQQGWLLWIKCPYKDSQKFLHFTSQLLNLTENSFMMQCTAVLCYQYIQITWCMYWLTLLQSNILRYAFQHSFTCTIFLKMSAVLYWDFFIIHVSSIYIIYLPYLIKSTEFLPAS